MTIDDKCVIYREIYPFVPQTSTKHVTCVTCGCLHEKRFWQKTNESNCVSREELTNDLTFIWLWDFWSPLSAKLHLTCFLQGQCLKLSEGVFWTYILSHLFNSQKSHLDTPILTSICRKNRLGSYPKSLILDCFPLFSRYSTLHKTIYHYIIFFIIIYLHTHPIIIQTFICNPIRPKNRIGGIVIHLYNKRDTYPIISLIFFVSFTIFS